MVSGEISISHYHHRVMIAQNSELRVLESSRSSENILYCEIHSTYVSVTLIFSSFAHLCMKAPIQSPCLGPKLKGTLWLRAGFPGGSDGKESACQCRRPGFNSWVGKIPWRRERLPTPVFLPGEFHGQRSLVDYSPWGYKESDTTE